MHATTVARWNPLSPLRVVRNSCTCATLARMVGVMDDPIDTHLQAVRDRLAPPLPQAAVELTELLTEVQLHITAALDEAMARAALTGVSMRAIASSAQLAPNSVPPRLARSAALRTYAERGKVTAEQIAVARADHRQQGEPNTPPPPFTFQPRRRSSS